MAKTLGQVAYRAFLDSGENWQAVADAVESAIEARRWKAIESAPTAATGTGTLTLSETIAGLREACAGVVVSKREVLTAAEVIAAAERALETIKHLSDWVSKDSTGDLAINGVAKNALAEIAKYKEAQNA
jgi:hypothetical protein